MILISDIFGCISGNSGLTEELIYSNILDNSPKYEVLSSSILESTKLGKISIVEIDTKEISVFEDETGILIARNGNAGFMTLLKTNGKYTTNDHAYIIYLLEDFCKKNNFNKINFLKWFIIKHQKTVSIYSTNNDNSTWNKTSFFKDCEIELPTNEELKKYSKHFDLRNNVLEFADVFKVKLDRILEKHITINDSNLANIQISRLFSYISRNDSLSEEGLYNIIKTEESSSIKVLSGSIENIFYGEIPINTEKIHFLNNKQGLHVVSRGLSGRLTYLKKGSYATNTNAFIFYLNEDIKNEIGITNEEDEEIYLMFMKIYLEPFFLDSCSNSDISIFPLTKVFDDMLIPKFVLNNEIKEVVKKYQNLENINTLLSIQKHKINLLIDKEVV